MKAKHSILPSVLVVALACACTPKAIPQKAAQPPTVSLLPAPNASAKPSALVDSKAMPRVSVAWPEKMPANPVIDGDLGEWGAIVPRQSEKKPAPQGSKESDAPAREGSPASLQRSHVAFAIANDAAFVLAELDAESKDGVWFGVSSPAAELPPIGYFQRGGGVIELDCEMNPMGQPLAEDELVACKRILESHDAYVASHKARFQKMFRLDKEGIRAIDAKGALSPIQNAIATTKLSVKGLLFEARLPLEALPRMSSAPINEVFLYADNASVAKPPVVSEEQWVGVSAAEPVSFEPLGDMRAASFDSRTGMTRASGFSYHPATPNLIEFVNYPENGGSFTLEATEKVLYEPLEKLGNVEVGALAAPFPRLAIRGEGKLVDLVTIDSEPIGAIIKDKAIHIFNFLTGINYDTNQQYAKWGVTVIDDKGSYTNPINEDTGVHSWSSVVDFHSEKWDRFGLRGIPSGFADEETPHPIEITWRYDKNLKGYMPTTREITNIPKPRQTKK